MTRLADPDRRVKSIGYTPDPADVAWVAANVTTPAVEVETDRDWLSAETGILANDSHDPAGAHSYAAGVVSDLVYRMDMRGYRDAALMVANGAAGVSAADLDELRPPAGPCASRFAHELYGLGSYYLIGSRRREQLVAWALFGVAADAERLNAADADDYVLLDAARRAALAEVFGDADAELWDTDLRGL